MMVETTFNEKLLRGVQGGGFLEKSPPGRRNFLKKLAIIGVGSGILPVIEKAFDLFNVGQAFGMAFASPLKKAPVRAEYFYQLENSRDVQCTLCPHHEKLSPGEWGKCRIRKNTNGELLTHGYGQPCILNIDPIGKNPLANFFPGIDILSIAHAGCNLRCLYCQNWEFSQKSPVQTRNISPIDPGHLVRKMKTKNLKGIGFTYTEPACCPEFVKEFASFCRDYGLKTTICTAGYIREKPFKDLLKEFDAVTIMFKGNSDRFYREVTGSSLTPVLRSMEIVKSEGKWLEAATLVVPGLNDSDDTLKEIARWIRSHLGENTPWHIEKFNPQFKLQKLPPTPQKTMERARQIGLDAGLKYVYTSNIAPHAGNHTYCHQCGKVIVKRMGFKVLKNLVNSGKCPYCSALIPGVWA
jgi:pyruvate formate lyase activating enzyme